MFSREICNNLGWLTMPTPRSLSLTDVQKNSCGTFYT